MTIVSVKTLKGKDMSLLARKIRRTTHCIAVIWAALLQRAAFPLEGVQTLKIKPFQLGEILATPGALQGLSPERIPQILMGHLKGDWGLVRSYLHGNPAWERDRDFGRVSEDLARTLLK